MVTLLEVLSVIIMSTALIVQIFALRNINKVNDELEPQLQRIEDSLDRIISRRRLQ